MLAASSMALVLSLLVVVLSIAMYYWIFSQDFPEDIFAAIDLSKGIISAIVLSVGWQMIFHSLRNFMVFELIVVGDKGIIRYFLNRKGKMRRNEILLFSHAQILERYEGPVDPYFSINKGEDIIRATWKEGNKVLFQLSYFRSDLKSKEMVETATKAYDVYRITRKPT